MFHTAKSDQDNFHIAILQSFA